MKQVKLELINSTTLTVEQAIERMPGQAGWLREMARLPSTTPGTRVHVWFYCDRLLGVVWDEAPDAVTLLDWLHDL